VTLMGAGEEEADLLAETFPENSRQFPLYNCSLGGVLRGAHYGTPAALLDGPPPPAPDPDSPGPSDPLRSSLLKADALMDDALDAAGDLLSASSASYSASIVDVLLNSYRSANSADRRLQDDRLLAFKAFWADTPDWFDPDVCERGRRLLSAHADRTMRACIFNALAICLSAPQSVLLLKYGSIEATSFNAEFYQTMNNDDGSYPATYHHEEIRRDMLPLVDAVAVMVLDLVMGVLSCQTVSKLQSWETDKDSLRPGNGGDGGHLGRGSPAWEKLVRAGAYLSILRRRAMSVFGADSWPGQTAGLPMSQG
jgi:hypothetical protein